MSAGELGVAELPALIPEAALAPLQAELAAVATSRESSSTKRRACKGVIRDAQALVRANPDAPNRFPVLALQLKAQQRLLQMENTQRNRDAFFATCEALAEAPDAYSRYRLSAELMLAERDLSARDADAAERIAALAAMRQRYRDIPGELEFLMAAVKIATQLGDYDFKEQLVTDLSERFAGNPTAINFRRTLIGATRMDIVFSGTFERFDGGSMTFPYDRLGHAYYAIFWSKESEESLAKLKQLKEQQDEFPGVLEIYSFNLDELPDAGNSIIKSIGLACTVLRLPGGVQSETFRTFALHMPGALRVNHFGHAIVPPSMAVHFKNAEEAKEFSHATVYDEFAYPPMVATGHVSSYGEYDRHLSQIQSLLIGDFLVSGGSEHRTSNTEHRTSKLGIDERSTPARDVTNSVTGVSTLRDSSSFDVGCSMFDVRCSDIQACFLSVPYRYRLSRAEALAQYRKASELCVKAIAATPKAPELWRVRNYRIVALMGIASLSNSATHFDQAVEESRVTVGLDLPDGAGVIARFCLAKAALRRGDACAKTIVEGLVADCGGEKAGLKAHAAAAILAIHADSRELYQAFRARILGSETHPQSLAPFVAFLRDRYHQYYVFRGNPLFYLYSREYRFTERRYKIDVGLTPVTLPLPDMQLKGLDGKPVSLPARKSERLTLLLFVEPSADGSNELARAIYAPPGEPTPRNKNPEPTGLLASAYGLARRHNNGLQYMTVFLSDDVARVKSIRDKHSLPGVVAVLPGGLDNPVVNQLGILSADRNVNSFLIRRDGTIAWRKNGLPYQMSGRTGYISPLAWESQIAGCDTEAGYRALKAKAYEKALQLFSGTYLEKVEADTPILPHHETAHKWKASRLHGRALAQLGLKKYEAALEDVDNAIAWHLRKGQFNHDAETPCTTMIHLQITRSKALDGLGRTSEARAARNKAAVKPTHYPTHYSRIRGFNEPYEVFEEKMSIVAKEIE